MKTKFQQAATFRKLAEAHNQRDAWDKLFDRIQEAAEQGKFRIIFDEEDEHAYFEEHRVKVAGKLRELGFKVEYQRSLNANSYHTWSYHNQYTIMW